MQFNPFLVLNVKDPKILEVQISNSLTSKYDEVWILKLG
jgi:hypothetical protein